MRYKEFKLNEAELLEAKMSPARLKAAAEELGAVAGMEFEMIVPDVSLRDEPSGNRFMSSSGRSSSRQRREPEYIEPEIDYDANEPFPFRNDWANRISYFFTHGQEPNSTDAVKRAIDKFKENYMEWEEYRLDSYIDFHQNEFTKLLMQNLENDPAFPTEEDRLAYANRLWDEEEIRGEEWKLAIDKMKKQFRSPVNFRSFLDSIEMRSMRDFGERYDLDWPYYIDQENFVTAFLNADIDRDVYMLPPIGYGDDDPTKVCKLNKGIYGLKQAPRGWNEKLVNTLKMMGFIQLVSEVSVFLCGVYLIGHMYRRVRCIA